MRMMMILTVMASALMMVGCGASAEGGGSSSQSNPIITNITDNAGHIVITNGSGDITECYTTGADSQVCTEETVIDAVFIPEEVE